MSGVFSPRCLCALALMGIASTPSAHARSQNQGATSVPPAKQAQGKVFQDVPSKSALYAEILDLDQKGYLKIPLGDYGGQQRRAKPLTRFEFAVTLQRMAAGMSVRTLSQDGTKLEHSFAIPHNLELKQVQEMLDLWTEFAPELKQLDSQPNSVGRIRKTLELFIAEFTPTAPKGGDKPSAGKPVTNSSP